METADKVYFQPAQNAAVQATALFVKVLENNFNNRE
jgi:hypothetical protein